MEMSHNDVFTPPDTKTGSEAEKKLPIQNCVVFILGTYTDSAVPSFSVFLSVLVFISVPEI